MQTQHQILHLSGCDGTGKSTLVKELSKATGFPSKHFDKPKDLKEGKEQYFKFLKALDSNVVCDRFHDGEWVYAPLYRNYTGNYMRPFERKIVEDFNYMFVHVKADLQTILDRTRIRGEDFVKEEHFQIVLDKFEKYLRLQTLPYTVVDTTNSKTEDDVNHVLKCQENLNEIWSSIKSLLKAFGETNFILPSGRLDPKYMIVADSTSNFTKLNYSTLNFKDFQLENEELIKNSWFTTLLPFETKVGIFSNKFEQQIESVQHLIKLQYRRLRPEKVYALDEKTASILEKLLNTKVDVLKEGN